jgi:hypothetical protein
MRTTAEQHRQRGEQAEKKQHYDLAAHEYYQGYRNYRACGRAGASDQMAKLERSALAKMNTLADSAREFEAQASKLTNHAVKSSLKRESQADDAGPALDRLAAAFYEEAANRRMALADRSSPGALRISILCRAVEDFEKAADHLSNAASKKEASTLHAKAKRINAQTGRVLKRKSAVELEFRNRNTGRDPRVCEMSMFASVFVAD